MHIDLHRHLEGSHSPHALLDVAQRFGIRHPLFFDLATGQFRDVAAIARDLTMPGPSDDASVFYDRITRAREAYVSVEAIGALARAAFAEAAAETDGYEMRLSLFSMARVLVGRVQPAWRDVAPAHFAERFARPILLEVITARDAIQAASGKPILLRLGLSRTFESEPHYRALVPIIREHAAALVGLDILGIVPGSDTEPLPPALVDIIDELRPTLPDLTIHAGELAGHDSVDRTLDRLAPHGIGHGVHALESPQTLARLARDGVTLEVCPVSNRMLIPAALAALEAAHGGHTPLRALQAAGVHCVLGSDDPVPMCTTFQNDYAYARAAGVDLERLTTDSLRRWAQITGAAFLPPR